MTVPSKPLSSIAIFGCVHELWPVAALLSVSLPEHIQLTIVEDNTVVAPPAALTLPAENKFHKSIGIEVGDLLDHCNGRLGLGTDLKDWRGDGDDFFAAPSGLLPSIDSVALHHIMLRAAHMHSDPQRLAYLYQPFRFAARTAMANKFSLPTDNLKSPAVMLGPTIQCDRGDYTKLLKEKFGSIAAQIVDLKALGVTLSPDDGTILSVQCDDGEEIIADLFIDTSGKLSSLLPDGVKAKTQSLSNNLPFDRLVSCKDEGNHVAEHGNTIARAMPGALLVETPLRTKIVSELIFGSDLLDEDALKPLIGEKATISQFEANIVDTSWTGNLVRLGGASASLGPYQSADMRMLHEQASLIATLIPARTKMNFEATEFNQQQRKSYEEIRDFVMLPFALNNRDDAPWVAIREAVQSKSLQLRLDQFNSRGLFVPYDNEIFDQQTWIELMIGCGLVPERYDPMTLSIDMDNTAQTLKKMAEEFNKTISAMPKHDEYMTRNIAGKE